MAGFRHLVVAAWLLLDTVGMRCLARRAMTTAVQRSYGSACSIFRRQPTRSRA